MTALNIVAATAVVGACLTLVGLIAAPHKDQLGPLFAWPGFLLTFLSAACVLPTAVCAWYRDSDRHYILLQLIVVSACMGGAITLYALDF